MASSATSNVAAPIDRVPDVVNMEFVNRLLCALEVATQDGNALKQFVKEGVVSSLLERCESAVAAEDIIVRLEPENEMCVHVHGDLHGHFFDLLRLLRTNNVLKGNKYCVFNGDFVDRGAWGVEVMLTLAALKLALPSQIFLLRGNHECPALSSVYGLQKELEFKYSSESGRRKASPLMKRFSGLFCALPLAALIGDTTLVVHGGLWRKPENKKRGKAGRRKPLKRSKVDLGGTDGTANSSAQHQLIRGTYKSAGLMLGTLDDLRKATKGGLNPGYNQQKHVVASDVLWSDPQRQRGLAMSPRGSGLLFGPDASEWFLRQNGLKLIIRSHEGPEARFGRDDMAAMDSGYSLDHDTNAGAVITVFSAADYPQFQGGALESERFNNKGAVLTLHPPSYCEYTILSYSAAPRPAAMCFCDQEAPDSADEMPECIGRVTDCEDTPCASENGSLSIVSTTSECGGGGANALHLYHGSMVDAEVLFSTDIGSLPGDSTTLQPLGRGQRARTAKRSA